MTNTWKSSFKKRSRLPYEIINFESTSYLQWIYVCMYIYIYIEIYIYIYIYITVIYFQYTHVKYPLKKILTSCVNIFFYFIYFKCVRLLSLCYILLTAFIVIATVNRDYSYNGSTILNAASIHDMKEAYVGITSSHRNVQVRSSNFSLPLLSLEDSVLWEKFGVRETWAAAQ